MLLCVQLLEVGFALNTGGKSVRPGMAAASAGDEPGPGAYGPSLTESWLVVSQPSEVPVPAFGSSIARQALSRCLVLINQQQIHPAYSIQLLPTQASMIQLLSRIRFRSCLTT